MGVVINNNVNENIKTNKVKKRNITDILFQWKYLDKVLFFSIISLLIIGVVFVYSTSIYFLINVAKQSPYSYMLKQIVNAAIGMLLYFLILNIPTNFYHKLVVPITFITIIIMILPFGFDAANGAKRWIYLPGGLQFQPSEIAKMVIVLNWSMASQKILKFSTKWETIKQRVRHPKTKMKRLARLFFLTWGYYIAITVTFLIQFRLQSDNGSLVISLLSIIVVLFSSGALPKSWIKIFWGLTIIGIVLILSGYIYLNSLSQEALIEFSENGYAYRRFVAWANPFMDYENAGYQLTNSLIAIANGGLFGVGIGKGLQKQGFLGDSYNDFIIANIAEEAGLFGFVGVFWILLLYVVIIRRGFMIARRANNMADCLIATGITALFAIQSFWNCAGITGLIPQKGLTAPLISYGGTSLVITLIALAILQRVNVQNQIRERERNAN
jgi:Bacterial cell division membrane protein